jgi:hypothetical protein
MNLPARRGLALTIIGPILMLVLAPAVLGIGIWRGVVTSNDRLDAHPWVRQGGSVQIADVRAQSILVSDALDDTSWVDCTVTGPTGEPRMDVSVDGSAYGSSYVEVATIYPTVPGSYALDCSTDRVKVVPTAAVQDSSHAFLVRFLSGLGMAALTFLAGVTALIVGIVKLVNSGNDRRRAQWAQAGYGYTGGYGYPQQAPPTGDPDDPYARP